MRTIGARGVGLLAQLAIAAAASAQSTVDIGPDGEGFHTSGAYSGGSTNYTNLQEPSDSDTTYLEFTDDAQIRTVTLANPGIAVSNAISQIVIHLRARNVTGNEALKWVLRTNSTTYESTGNTGALATSYTDYTFTRTTNPDTNRPWTWSELNALEVGAKSVVSGSWENVRVTSVWVVVTYNTGTVVVKNTADVQGYTKIQDAENYITNTNIDGLGNGVLNQDWTLELRTATAFAELVTIDGNTPSSGKRLYVKAQTGITPTVTGSAARVSCFDIRDNYVVLDGIKMTNAAGTNSALVLIKANNNITIQNCTLYTTEDAGIWMDSEGADAITIQDCTFYDMDTDDGALNFVQAAIVCGDTNLSVTNVTIKRCLFYDCGQQAISILSDAATTGILIENCTFHNNTTAILTADSDNCEIYVGDIATDGITIKNNIFQNTNEDTDQMFIHLAGAAGDLKNPSDYNCYYQTDGTRFGIALTYKSFTDWKTDTGEDGNSITSDPLFEDENNTTLASRDYHLQSTYGYKKIDGLWYRHATNQSPCIDAGATGDTYTSEIEDNGNRINQGHHGNTSEASKGGSLGQNYWIGYVNGNWNNHGNWAHGIPGTSNNNIGMVQFDPADMSASLNPNPVTVNLTMEGSYSCYMFSTTGNSGDGTMAVGSNTLTVGVGGVWLGGATVTVGSGEIKCGGDWSRTSGTFTAGTGTVTMDGTATARIRGSLGTTFNTLVLASGLTDAQSKTINIGHDTAASALTTTAASVTIGTVLANTTATVNLGTNASGDNTTAQTLTVTGNITINGTGSSTLVSVGSTYAHAINIGGNYTNNGTFTSGVGVVTFTSTSTGKTLGGTLSGTSGRFYDLTFNGSGGGWTMNATTEVVRDFTVSAGSVTAPSATLTIGRHFSNSATFTHNSGTVTFDTSTTPADITGSSNTTFNNLNLGTTLASGSKTINIGHTAEGSSLIIAAADIHVGSTTGGATVTVNLGTRGAGNNTAPQTLRSTGNFEVNSTGTNTLESVGSSVSHAIQVGGHWANNGMFKSGGGYVEFTSTSTGKGLNGTLSGTNGKFYDLFFTGSGGGWTLNATTEVVRDFGISAGSVTAPSTTLTVGGYFSNDATFTHNSGTVTLDTTMTGGIRGAANTTFNVLNLGTTLGSGSKTINIGHTTASSSLTVVAATLNVGSTTGGVTITVNLGSNGSDNTAVQTLTATGTLTINGTGTNTLVSKGSTYAHAINVGGDWVNNGSFTANVGSVILNGTTTAALKGSVSTTFYSLVLGSGLADAQSKTINIGHSTVGSALTTTATTVTIGTALANTTTTVNLGNNGTADNTIPQNLTTSGNFTINGTGTNSFVNVGSSLLHMLTIGGSYTNNGTFTAGMGGVTFNSTSTGKTLSGTMTGSSQFRQITFNGSGGGWTFNANADVIDSFTVMAGTVTAPSGTLTLNGDFWNMGGTFTHNSGTVTMGTTRTAYITGSAATTFNVLNLGTTLGSGSKTINIGHSTASSALTVTAATLNIGSTTGGVTVTVNLGSNSGGNNTVAQTLTVTGNLTINGTGTNTLVSVGSSYQHEINVGGNWTNNGAFTRGIGRVTFNGGAFQSLGGSVSTTFYKLRANQTSFYGVSIDTDLTVENQLEATSGNWDVGPGRTITMTTGASVTIAGGGLSLRGSSGSNATLTSAGTYSMTVTSNGEISFEYCTVTGLNNSGIVFGSTGIIHLMNETTFNIGGTGPALDVSSMGLPVMDQMRLSAYSFVNVTFAKTSPSSTDKNIKASTNSPSFTFLGAAGSMGSATYEDDGANRIDWVNDAVERILYDTGTVTANNASPTVTGSGTTFTGNVAANDKFRVRGDTNEYTVSTVDSDTQITLSTNYRGTSGSGKSYEVFSSTKWSSVTAAVSAGGNSARYRWRYQIPTAEKFDVQTAKSTATQIILENVKWYRAGNTCVEDSDGGTARRVVLRNCSIGAGSLSEADLYNCTLFDKTGIPPTVTDCGAMNSIFSIAPTLADINGGDPDANLTSVAASLFVNPYNFDFHLKSTASTAIDSGQVPSGGYAYDLDGQARPYNGTWDIGADEYMGSAATPKALTVSGGASEANLGRVTRFMSIGGTRGTASGYTFGYAVTSGGGIANNNVFLVVRWNSSVFEIVTSYTAPGPILFFTHRVDVTAATSSWRALILLVGDFYKEDGTTGQDTYGDCCFALWDKGDSGLSHPTAAVTASDITTRRFGSVDYYGNGSFYINRPVSGAVNYRFTYLNTSVVNPDGTADANGDDVVDSSDPTYDSPAGTNRVRWWRLYILAYKRTSTTGGACLKVNVDPYDSDSTVGPDAGDNQAFGEYMWAIVPSTEDSITNSTTTGLYQFAYTGWPAFTWASGFQEFFVPVSKDTGTVRTLVVRFSLAGLTAPSISRNWQAEVNDENDFGVWLDNGNTGAALTYGESDGSTVYNRNVESSSGTSGARWATRLKDAAGSTVTLTMQPMQNWGSNFALTGGDGVVEKIWSQRGTETSLAGATTGGEATITVDSTTGFPSSGTIYLGSTTVTYTGKTSTTFTGCSGVGTHPIGAPVTNVLGNGCRAGDGIMGKVESSATEDESSQISGRKDPDWPIQCVGKPVGKVVANGTKIYWATTRGYVYGLNWNSSGSSVAGGDETLISGFPYVLPGEEITGILIMPGSKLMIWTTRSLYLFEA